MTNMKRFITLGVSIPVLIAISLYSNVLCSCLSPADVAFGNRSWWADMDVSILQKVVDRRFPSGTPEIELKSRYILKDKYCKTTSRKSVVCLFPHDGNVWRERYIEMTFVFNDVRNLDSITVVKRTRYLWE